MESGKGKRSKNVYTTGNLGETSKNWLERNWMFILLALLLIGLFLGILRGCDSDDIVSRYDPVPAPVITPPNGGQYVPPKIPMVPIDTSKIGYGRDKVTPIVLDRINILLEKVDDNTAAEFQTEFKRLYPSPHYMFTYFDELTYRLQISVPEDKRDYIMDNLNAQMPQFEFYMFDESVFASSYTPSDPGFTKNLDWYFKAIKCFEAWEITRGADSIKIAVVDNGFDLTHADLKGHYVYPYNTAEHSANVYLPYMDEPLIGHGTHVASTACGRYNNSVGLCGIAPECTLIPVQVADRNGYLLLTNIIDGILYSIYKGADVINVSLGSVVNPLTQFLSPQDQLQLIFGLKKNEERVWDEIFKIANNRRAILVVSAGNQNVLSGFDAMKRNNSTIIVSAVDENFQKADFSNYGNYTDIPYCYSTISAPGTNIINAYPGNKVISMDGTSMASPIVAGAVGLMKSLQKDLTAEQIIEILQNTGIPTNEPIGNIIQLDAALKAVQSGDYGNKNPSDKHVTKPTDKLRTGDLLDDISNLYGMWKSTKQLLSTNQNDVDLYMIFSPDQNQIIIVETSNNNKMFTGYLDVQLSNGTLLITQTTDAYATNGDWYQKNKFVCTTDKQGYLACDLLDMNGNPRLVQFNLVRIQ